MTLSEQIDKLIDMRGDEDGGVSVLCEECENLTTRILPLCYWGWNLAGRGDVKTVDKFSDVQKVILDHIYDHHREYAA